MTTLPNASITHVVGNRYSVSLGGGTYTVSADGVCGCKGFFYRGRCRHVDALREHLEQERACPHCKGAGYLRMRSSYESNRVALPCIHCSGSGLRQAEALPPDAELRHLFG